MKGASGQMIQAANLLLGLPGDHRPAAARDPAVSVTAAKGFVAGGLACGIKESGAPDLALVATDDHRAGRRGGGVHDATSRRPRRCRSRAPPRRRARRRGRPQLRQRQRGHRRARPARRAPHVRARRRRASTTAPTDVLVCSTGLIGIPMPMARARGRHPEAVRHALAPTGGADAAQAILTTDTVRKEATAAAGNAIVGGMAKGAAMLSPAMATMLAVLTTDAAVDPARAAAVARAGRERDLRLPQRRRVPLDQRHRDRAGQRSGRRGRPGAADRRAHRACAARSPSRWRATPRARRSSCASAWSAPAPRPRRASPPARWPTASSCSARSTAAMPTGAGCSRSSARAARSSIPSRSTSPTTASRCAATASRARTTKPRSAAHMASREIEMHCDLRLAHGEATVLTTDLSHAYIDENRRTS